MSDWPESWQRHVDHIAWEAGPSSDLPHHPSFFIGLFLFAAVSLAVGYQITQTNGLSIQNSSKPFGVIISEIFKGWSAGVVSSFVS